MFKKNKAAIGKNSNNNTIVQGCTYNNPVFLDASANKYKILSDAGQYDQIQDMFSKDLLTISQGHSLYPVFKTTYDSELKKLVSTPATEEALQKYPRRIKGTLEIDRAKYPYMDKSETPWDYVYRTQQSVELKTTAYREYLGDVEDPFPIIKYSEGMITVITPPEFPQAVEAIVSSGQISVPVLFRRKPCMEYSKTVFGTVSDTCGLDILVISDSTLKKTEVKIRKLPDCELRTQLLRERLVNALSNTRRLSISVGGNSIVNATFNGTELSNNMFAAAPYMIRFIECLIAIEQYTSCRFDTSINEITQDDYINAHIMVSSLQDQWLLVKTVFDDETRCHYDHIDGDILKEGLSSTETTVTYKSHLIDLKGQQFVAEASIVVYRDARINNIDSVIKNYRRRKKDILFTFRPIEGKAYISKLCKFDNISLLPSENQ